MNVKASTYITALSCTCMLSGIGVSTDCLDTYVVNVVLRARENKCNIILSSALLSNL